MAATQTLAQFLLPGEVTEYSGMGPAWYLWKASEDRSWLL